MEILNYIQFKDNITFVEWQKEKNREVVSVTPLASTFDTNMLPDGERASGSIDFGIFVVYIEDPEIPF